MIVLDGPMGTLLAERGVPTPEPGWSAHAIEAAPEVVAEIHRAYAGAGATVHTANTFRTKRRQFPDRWERLAREAVTIARRSVPSSHRVAASIAPLEDCWRPDLSPPSDVARKEHAELANVLADAGADILLCETFAGGREAAIATEAAARTGKETWTALTAGPDANLMTPQAMKAAARACVDAGARAILVNCTPAGATLRYLEPLACLGVPYGAYANGGKVSVDEYVQYARTYVDLGATIVGSCCFTGPVHITEIAKIFAAGRNRAGRT